MVALKSIFIPLALSAVLASAAPATPARGGTGSGFHPVRPNHNKALPSGLSVGLSSPTVSAVSGSAAPSGTHHHRHHHHHHKPSGSVSSAALPAATGFPQSKTQRLPKLQRRFSLGELLKNKDKILQHRPRAVSSLPGVKAPMGLPDGINQYNGASVRLSPKLQKQPISKYRPLANPKRGISLDQLRNKVLPRPRAISSLPGIKAPMGLPGSFNQFNGASGVFSPKMQKPPVSKYRPLANPKRRALTSGSLAGKVHPPPKHGKPRPPNPHGGPSAHGGMGRSGSGTVSSGISAMDKIVA